jgi:uncharacterized membrane protein YbaN (DUF454 family)
MVFHGAYISLQSRWLGYFPLSLIRRWMAIKAIATASPKRIGHTLLLPIQDSSYRAMPTAIVEAIHSMLCILRYYYALPIPGRSHILPEYEQMLYPPSFLDLAMALWTECNQVTDSVVRWVTILVMNVSTAFDAGWFPSLAIRTFLVTAPPPLTSFYQVTLCFRQP